MQKRLSIAALVTAALFITGIAFSSAYYLCIYKVKVKEVLSKPVYNSKKKSYTIRTRFIARTCVKNGGFLPNLCKNRINKTYIKNIILPSKKHSRFIKPGKSIKLKYTSARGYTKRGKYSWHNWKLVK